uniref:Uncharacterized protein n=1 Tax=Coccidioides posadasii RMSCC 3488 TaxID=454284 RepID=A0A0J6FHL9_COCPO|nr:hypothetical protein CPAG_08935 [Coccidioides posadasii RMSCC 3488]
MAVASGGYRSFFTMGHCQGYLDVVDVCFISRTSTRMHINGPLVMDDFAAGIRTLGYNTLSISDFLSGPCQRLA